MSGEWMVGNVGDVVIAVGGGGSMEGLGSVGGVLVLVGAVGMEERNGALCYTANMSSIRSGV
jgi:hypothetical protein